MTDDQRDQRPTQKSIAEKAGVSVGAVSRALADDPKIATETRQLVHKIARELGYAPDRAAQRLRTGKTQVVNLILPPHDEIFGFGTSLIRGITRGLEGSAYHLVVTPDFGPEEDSDVISRIVKNKLADGVMFSRTEPNDPRVKFLSESGFPFVSHGRTELATPHPFVDYDNFGFAYESALRMIRNGATKLAILLPPPNLTFRQHLLHGFMTAVRETGVAFEILEGATLDSSAEQIEATIAKRFSQSDRPDGIVLPGEVSGLATLAAVQDLGLVPEKDVRLVVKQTSGLFSLTRPQVDSLYEDLAAAGFQMAKLMRKRIENAPIETLQYVQPMAQGPNS